MARKCVRATMPRPIIRFLPIAVAALVLSTAWGAAVAEEYDLVLLNGRVMNPANGLDSVRNIGISDGRIEAISRDPLEGRQQVDAGGLVVAPGFIDLHAHGQREFESWLQAQDGVTTMAEAEALASSERS